MDGTRSMRDKKKVVYKMSVTEPEWKRPLGKPTCVCQDLTEIACVRVRVCVCVRVVEECIHLAEATNSRDPLKIWELLEELSEWHDSVSRTFLRFHRILFYNRQKQLSFCPAVVNACLC